VKNSGFSPARSRASVSVRVLALVLVQVRQQRRVGPGREAVTAREQLALDRLVVVELAVRHPDHVAGLALQHARGLARRHDREPGDPQRAVAAVPQRLARGAAMAQARDHAAHELQALRPGEIGGHQSGDAAHRLRNLLVLSPGRGALARVVPGPDACVRAP